MASDRLSALRAFDDTKAGVKGLVDAGATAIPAIFHHPPDSFTPSTLTTDVAVPVVDLSCSRSDAVGAVKAAAETAGFFLLANHGVPEAAMSGMLAALVSNDRFKSPVHRVVSRRVGPRVSVACFFRANGATVCAPAVVDGSGPPRYRSVKAEEMLCVSNTQTRLNNLRL
uniref:Non-haem dioxygenase N-terminal domain-containing protein n=1 Tax=Hordeum vulgare subsp. vulgare TaxID=112509 RepID=A0A8I6XGU4_HORVV